MRPACYTWAHWYYMIITVDTVSAEFPKKLIARGRYLKCFQRLNKNASTSKIQGNCGIKCLKHKANFNLVPRVLSPLPDTPPRSLRKYPGTGWSRVTNFLGDNKNFVGGVLQNIFLSHSTIISAPAPCGNHRILSLFSLVCILQL